MKIIFLMSNILEPIEVKIVDSPDFWSVLFSALPVIISLLALLFSIMAYNRSYQSRLSINTGKQHEGHLIENGENKGKFENTDYLLISLSNIGICPANITIKCKAESKKADITSLFAVEEETTYYQKGIFVIQIPSGKTKVLRIAKNDLKQFYGIETAKDSLHASKVRFFIYSNSKRVKKVHLFDFIGKPK